MSTSYFALLSACCVLDGSEVTVKIDALEDENTRDLAWEVVNDLTAICNEYEGAADQPMYIGQQLASGTAYSDDKIDSIDLFLALEKGITPYREKTLITILDGMGKSKDPQLHAFIDWLLGEVKQGDWGLRLIPSWG